MNVTINIELYTSLWLPIPCIGVAEFSSRIQRPILILPKSYLIYLTSKCTERILGTFQNTLLLFSKVWILSYTEAWQSGDVSIDRGRRFSHSPSVQLGW